MYLVYTVPRPLHALLLPSFPPLPVLVGERQLRKDQIFTLITISGPLISSSEGLRAGRDLPSLLGLSGQVSGPRL